MRDLFARVRRALPFGVDQTLREEVVDLRKLAARQTAVISGGNFEGTELVDMRGGKSAGGLTPGEKERAATNRAEVAERALDRVTRERDEARHRAEAADSSGHLRMRCCAPGSPTEMRRPRRSRASQ